LRRQPSHHLLHTSFYVSSSHRHRDLHSFPTRRSSDLLNLFFAFYHRTATRLGERQAAYFLGYDLLQLGLLLYLTGGLQNPFSILILAPVTVAATILSQRPVAALAVFAVAIVPVLAHWHMPLPGHGNPLVFPS